MAARVFQPVRAIKGLGTRLRGPFHSLTIKMSDSLHLSGLLHENLHIVKSNKLTGTETFLASESTVKSYLESSLAYKLKRSCTQTSK